MRRIVLAVVIAASAAVLAEPPPAWARASGLYDMRRLLDAPHPFAAPTVPERAPAPPAAQPPAAAPDALPEDDDLLLDDLAPEEDVSEDWLEPVNRVVFEANDIFLTVFFRPVAKLYQIVVPEVVRKGVRNGLTNLTSPVILANDLLQGEGTRAWETTQRFVVNSTLGLAGTIDVADRWLGIPPHKEDFGQTMAVWGVPDGGYLVLPLLGPSSPRDAFGTLAVDSFLDPLNLWLANTNRDPYIYARQGTTALAEYEALVDRIDAIRDTSVDFYASLRSLYRQRREADIANDRSVDVPEL